jgi:hypothetical protein
MAGKKRSPLDALGVRVTYADPAEGYRQNPSVRTRHGRVTYSKKEAQRRIKNDALKQHVKKMRPYFGDLFKAKSGFDLRKPDSWTPAQKAKVTKYWQVIAPQAARDHEPRYYKNKENLEAAILYTQQERPLPGQKAALYALTPGETLTVKVRKGRVKARRNSVEVDKVYFDPDLLLADPIAAGREALAELEGARLFKLMFGPHESRGTFKSPEAVLNAMAFFIGRYGDDEYDSDDPFSHHYGNWLGGIIGYFGRRETVENRLEAEDSARFDAVTERKRERGRRREDIRRGIIREAVDKRRGKKKRKKKGRK